MLSRGLVLVAAFLTACLPPCPASAADWPDWRGPREDRQAGGEPAVVTSFDPEKGTNVLWKNDEAGGISTPVVMGGRLYTLVRHKPGTKEEAEKVLCLDAKTGQKLWDGEQFQVLYVEANVSTVDWKALAKELAIPAELIAKHTKTAARFSLKCEAK
jgi:hypothetical protein